jgi:hypothetical protein
VFFEKLSSPVQQRLGSFYCPIQPVRDHLDRQPLKVFPFQHNALFIRQTLHRPDHSSALFGEFG